MIAVVQLVDRCSIQLEDWALWIYVPLSSIEVLLHQDGIAKWAARLMIGDEAAKAIDPSSHASDLVDLVRHHDRHHVG